PKDKSSTKIQAAQNRCTQYEAQTLNCKVCLGLPCGSTDKCIREKATTATPAPETVSSTPKSVTSASETVTPAPKTVTSVVTDSVSSATPEIAPS
ncbi:hypothetical protein BGZ91_009461, partial [Linnemannia elongata]